jgi:hypothetical protein
MRPDVRDSRDVFVGPMLSGNRGTQVICVSRHKMTPHDYERAARVVLRDADTIQAAIGAQLRMMHERDARGRALRRDAAGMSATDVLLAIRDGVNANQ